MFSYNQIFIEFFRLLNFGIIIAVLWYCFKQYILNNAYLKINEQKENEHLLIKKQQDAAQELQKVKETLIHQQKNQELLLSKVREWQQQYAQLRLVKQQEILKQKEHLTLLITKQQERLEKERLKSIVLPHAMHKAEQELKQYFSQSQHDKNYIQEIVDYMKKSSL